MLDFIINTSYSSNGWDARCLHATPRKSMINAGMKATGSEGQGEKRHLRFNPRSFLSFLKSSQAKTRGSVSVVVTAESVSMAHIQDQDKAPQLNYVEYKPVGGVVDRSEVLNELITIHKLSKARCIGMLEPNTYTLHLVESPNVEVGELRSALRWRIKELIDFDIEDAAIDAFDVPGKNLRGKGGGMIYAVAAKKAEILKQHAFFKEHGLNLEVLDIPELALRNITSLLPEDKDGVALLYLTRHRGFIILTRQSTLYIARTINIGTLHLERASSQENEDDEIFKSEFKTIFEGIVIEIQRSLDYYDRHSSNPSIEKLMVSAVEYQFPGMVISQLSANLGLEVKKLDLNTVLDSKTEVSDKMQAHCLFAIGLALRDES